MLIPAQLQRGLCLGRPGRKSCVATGGRRNETDRGVRPDVKSSLESTRASNPRRQDEARTRLPGCRLRRRAEAELPSAHYCRPPPRLSWERGDCRQPAGVPTGVCGRQGQGVQDAGRLPEAEGGGEEGGGAVHQVRVAAGAGRPDEVVRRLRRKGRVGTDLRSGARMGLDDPKGRARAGGEIAQRCALRCALASAPVRCLTLAIVSHAR
eukprot:scaffold47621_cov58-Phaeocystis_antarctica.AAC.3